jgi:DNA (cytosine-5)-methyltransferase 1
LNSVELFAGAGGLAMGVAKAGFRHKAIIEWDKWACDTIQENKRRGVSTVKDWPDPFDGDIRDFDYSPFIEKIDLVSGGPPCQPFSLGGKHRGFRDDRDMFPEAARAVRELRPKAFVFENVRGLMRPAFTNYLEYIRLRLTYPEVTRRETEEWLDHLSRLERHHTGGTEKGLVYNVIIHDADAANFGIPQKRHRVFIVGFLEDLKVKWNFPKESHSLASLLWSQWVTDIYWDKHKVSRKDRPDTPTQFQKRVARLKWNGAVPPERPWKTVRDCLREKPNLPEPMEKEPAKGILNHELNPGARSYPGHTGSLLDLPSKALKAGVHGVPGGENMLAYYDGKVRYFTVREAARLQTFPDQYIFHGAWSECMRQLGNALPVDLAVEVARSIKVLL